MHKLSTSNDEFKASADIPQRAQRWVAVRADVFDHDALSHGPYDRRSAWLWLVANAAWKPRRINHKGRPLQLERGQVLAGRRHLGQTWGWGEKQVRNFLEILRDQKMIEGGQSNGHFANVITICNYDRYQTATERANQSEGQCGASAGPVQGQTLTLTTKDTLRDNNYPSNLDAARDELACLNGARVEIIEQMAAWMSPYAPDRQSAERWLQTTVSLHGGEVVKQAFGELRAKIVQGDLIARPIPLFDKICQRIKADAARKAAPTPAKPKITYVEEPWMAEARRALA